MTPDEKLTVLGYRWRAHKDRPECVPHLTKRGVAVCGQRVSVRNSTIYFGPWGRCCKKCVKLSGSGK